LAGSGRCLSICCVSEALVTGRMKTAKPVRGQPAETMALLFCFLSWSDPETQQQHWFVHTYRATNSKPQHKRFWGGGMKKKRRKKKREKKKKKKE